MPSSESNFPLLLRLTFLASIILGTAAMGVAGYWSWQREARELNNNLQIQAGFLASASQAVFDNMGNGLAPLGDLLQTLDVLDHPELARPHLVKFQSRFPEVGSMAIIRPDGLMLVNTSSAPGTTLPDYRNDHPYLNLFRTSLTSQSPYMLGPPEYGKILKQWRFPFRYTVRDETGAPLFVLQAAIPLENRGIYLYDLPLPPSSFIGLLREDGLQQARWPAANPHATYGRISPGPLAKLLQQQPQLKEGLFSGYSSWIAAEKQRIGAFKRLAHLPIYAYVSVPVSYVYERWWRNNAVTLGVFLVYLAIFSYVARRVTRHERIHSSELHGQARLDSLTGTPNRTGADELLERQLLCAAETGGSFAVLFLDLDRFKDINDTHGHGTGDALLAEVVRRLSAHLHQDDMLARVGGDEFMVILPGADMDSARHTAERLIKAFSEPFQAHGKKLQISCSIGAATFPAHGNTREDLLKCADTAMYEAKRAGRGRFAMYEERFGIVRQRRLALQEQLQRALEKNQFLLHYQPILDLQSRRIVAAEALLRWQDESGRQHSAAEFISVAEESGLILTLGEWVLNQACEQAQAWADAGFPIRIAVNLSPRQFRATDLVDQVRNALQRTGLAPSSLELEITESTAMDDPESSIRVLTEFKRIGVSIAIDDFGTGYSSLSYLKRIPADKLKIDKSFVDGVATKLEDAAIVRSMLALAASFDMETVAEGIEEEAQMQALIELGCHYGQGYLFSRPLTPQVLTQTFFEPHDKELDYP
ncbi:MAG: bifunctional diguanylate cyclase/phosphodiesterase [Thiobacillus sp.]